MGSEETTCKPKINRTSNIDTQSRVSAAYSVNEPYVNQEIDREIIGLAPERIAPDTRIYSTATMDDNFLASSVMH